MQGPRHYVVNSQSEEAAPRVLGLLSRLQMQPSAGAMQVVEDALLLTPGNIMFF